MSILKSILGQFEAMLNHHSRVHVLRFDLHLYRYTLTNEIMTVFNRRFHKWIKRRYKSSNIGFTWVREQGRAEPQHYHYALFMDGAKVQHPAVLQQKAREIWAAMAGRFVQIERPYYNVNSTDHDGIQAAVYRLSYLAKTRSKGNRPNQTKDYGTSRLK